IRAILLHEFKLGRKAIETTRNIKFIFGEKSISEHTAQHQFQKFRDGNESLENEEEREHPLATDNNDLKTIAEADTRKTTRKTGKIVSRWEKCVQAN
ncbi:Histone-lysine N-methyltransferase SETMAR, partial [Harpegnathos saltator]